MERLARIRWRLAPALICLGGAGLLLLPSLPALAMSPYQKAALRALDDTAATFGQVIEDDLDAIDESNKSDDAKKRERIDLLRKKLDEAKERYGERSNQYRLVRFMLEQDSLSPGDRELYGSVLPDKLQQRVDGYVSLNPKQQAFVNVVKRFDPKRGAEIEQKLKQIARDPHLRPDEIVKVQQEAVDKMIGEVGLEEQEQRPGSADAANRLDNVRSALRGVRATTDPNYVIDTSTTEWGDYGQSVYYGYKAELDKLRAAGVTIPGEGSSPPERQAEEVPPPRGSRYSEPFGYNPPPGGGAVPTSYDVRFGYSGWVGGTFSVVSQGSIFGGGTVVNGGEHFAASVPDSITRPGFDIGGRLSLPGAGWIVRGDSYVSMGFAYASGSASSSSGATVGVDGVSEVGLTFLMPDGTYGTGGSIPTPDNYIESTAGVSNTWAIGTLGYGERFHPFGPDGPKAHIGLAVAVEGFDQDFTARSDIYDPSPLTRLAYQVTTGSTSDRYYGVRFDTGLDYRVAPGWTLGVAGYVTPSYHTGSGQIAQENSIGSVSQQLSYDASGFTLSGGIGVHLTWHPRPNLSVRFSLEHSCLGDVTQLYVPANPNEQPAHFGSGLVTRDFGKLGLSLRF